MAVLREAGHSVGNPASAVSTEEVLVAAFTAAEAGDREQEAMKTMKRKAIPFAIFAISIGTGAGMAQQSAQPMFSSAAEAGQSLFQAVQSNSEAAISQILGGSTDLASSHDDGQDKVDREIFVQKYQEMHRLHREADGTVTLYIGAENWPFPIPIVQKNGAWRFDVAAGQQEVRFRRIGENELTVISVCHEFASGKRDRADVANSTELHGYYFRALAPAKAAGGFAVVAYPAEYRSSGVMTFVLTEKGEVYEKDLGANTSAVAGAMASFHKDATWRAAGE